MPRSALCLTLTVLAVTGGFAGGCFSPDYENGGLRCGASERCPENYYCAPTVQRCWRNGTAPPPPTPIDAGAGEVPPAVIDAPDALGDTAPPDGEPDPDVPADPAATLRALTLMPGNLVPAFSPGTLRYDLDLPLFTRQLAVTATAEQDGATLLLNNIAQASSTFMATVPLLPGLSKLEVSVRLGMAESIYRISISTGGLVTYVKPPNTHAGMSFGKAIAIAGGTMVVGAPDDSSMGTGPQAGDVALGGPAVGAAFVFTRGERTWKKDVILKPVQVQPGMKFGAAVAVAGDLVVVGAPAENSSTRMINGPQDTKASMSGAAYVFTRTAAGWVQEAYLKAADAATGDLFGTSVAVAVAPAAMGGANVTVAVGAPGASGPGNTAHGGAVYVFVRNPVTGVWSQQATPHPNNPKGPNEFGTSVALSGETLVVGAPLEDSGASGVNPGGTSATAGDSGAAFVFTRNGTVWAQPTYIKAPRAVTSANFGARVALADNLLAISAPRDPSGARGIDQGNPGNPAADSGAVFLYQRNGNVWSLLHTIKASNAHPADFFGQSLALSPTTLVVGAPFEDTNTSGAVDPDPNNIASDSGAVYVFRPMNGRWTQLIRLKAPNAEKDDHFGNAVATEGDAVIVGAEGEAGGSQGIDGNLANNSAAGSGAVYVY